MKMHANARLSLKGRELLVDRGTLPALHVRPRVCIRRSDFEALLEPGFEQRQIRRDVSVADARADAACCELPRHAG
jgi:hypothetical protein